ncbi:MAG: ADP-ribosylglycohydrolase family protein [Candidatus Firestonebacteria bacterium]
MKYPKIPKLGWWANEIVSYAQLKHEYGTKNISPVLKKAENSLKEIVKTLKNLPINQKLAKKEPNDLCSIQALRPEGPRRLWRCFNRKEYTEKIAGALLGRFAGCTLGAPVEFWEIEKMKNLAKENKEKFPPRDYWTYVYEPCKKRYKLSTIEEYTRYKMNGVPVDDDIAYTQLGLLIMEDYGPNFTVADVGKAWRKYLPCACTAEKIALENLKKGVLAKRAGAVNNPYCEWIGADIRSDPWGYLAPGWPEKAAKMAYTDAYISHRRQGIYGEMYFSAVIAAAFTVDTPVEALELGLTEIPKNSEMTKAVKWALEISPKIKNYKQARAAVEKRYKGMNGVHTINNACLTIWGLTIGGTDFTRVIGETVAMGLDNDCTAATAGSIVGAIIGKKGIPKRWYKRFNNTAYSYLNKNSKFSISGMVERFTKQAERVYADRQ